MRRGGGGGEEVGLEGVEGGDEGGCEECSGEEDGVDGEEEEEERDGRLRPLTFGNWMFDVVADLTGANGRAATPSAWGMSTRRALARSPSPVPPSSQYTQPQQLQHLGGADLAPLYPPAYSASPYPPDNHTNNNKDAPSPAPHLLAPPPPPAARAEAPQAPPDEHPDRRAAFVLPRYHWSCGCYVRSGCCGGGMSAVGTAAGAGRASRRLSLAVHSRRARRARLSMAVVGRGRRAAGSG